MKRFQRFAVAVLVALAPGLAFAECVTKTVGTATMTVCSTPDTAEGRAADAALCDREAGTPLSGIEGVAEVYPVDLAQHALAGGKDGSPDLNWFLDVSNACFHLTQIEGADPRFEYQMRRVKFIRWYLTGYTTTGPSDVEKAYEYFAEFARQGKPDAQAIAAQIGWKFWLNNKPKRDENQALWEGWTRAAADAGYSEAMRDTANVLGFDKNPDAEIYSNRLASEAPLLRPGPDDTRIDVLRFDAKFRIVRDRIQAAVPGAELDAAVADLTAWSAAGDPFALLLKAEAMRAGTAMPLDPVGAAGIYRDLMQQAKGEISFGYRNSARELAIMLIAGEGMAPDPAEARALLTDLVTRAGKRATAQDVGPLLPLLIEGRGGPQDMKTARQLYQAYGPKLYGPIAQEVAALMAEHANDP